MTQYIDKATIAAEIERRIKEHHSGYRVALKDILSFLDTLEVKKVDLDRAIAAWKYSISKADKSEESINHYIESIAKYFFELGLKAQKGE